MTLDANVLFASGSADLTPEASSALCDGRGRHRRSGHGRGGRDRAHRLRRADSFNQTLSEQRAASVLAVLQPASGSAVTFVAVGKGESAPVADNTTDEGKQANRRVTVVYSVKGES